MDCPNTTIYPLANFSNRNTSVFIQEFFDFLGFLRRYWRRTSAALFVHHTLVSVFIPQVPLMQCRPLHCSIAVCIDQHFHSFFSVFSIENTEFNRCSLLDAHFDAPCINKWPLTLKWRHTLMWRHWRRVKIWRHTVLKFGDDIGSDASDRRHFRRDTRLRFVTFWAGCYEITITTIDLSCVKIMSEKLHSEYRILWASLCASFALFSQNWGNGNISPRIFWTPLVSFFIKLSIAL